LAIRPKFATRLGVPTADFEIAYDGEALRMGTMDVRELAPALLAIGDLCQEANTLLNGDLATVAVKVKAIGRGSFDVNLILDQLPALTKVINLFPDDLKTAKELTWYLFGSQGAVLGLIGLIKLLKGKPIQSTQILKDGSTVIDFTNANLTNSQITVAPSVRRLYEDPPARRAAERIVKPLEREGIEVFRVKEGGTLIEEVSRDEVGFFKTPETLLATADNSENERIVTLQIVTASFEDRYQWRFTDGNMTLTARIEDPLFFERIDRGERFGKGDILRVQLHQRQWRDEKGLHAEYRILTVLEVIPAPQQMKLS
jgi:hypothetical protein